MYGSCATCGKTGELGHQAGSNGYCCTCWVRAGNPPADWHTGCMVRYAELKGQITPEQAEESHRQWAEAREPQPIIVEGTP